MSQYFRLPAASVTATNPSVGTNGSTAPASSTLVAGINPGGNQNPLHTDVSNNLLVSVQAVPTNQSVNLTQVGGAAIAIGQAAMAASMPVAIASNQGNVPVSQATAASLNATVVQGTAAAAAGAWPAKVTDGTNTAAVKAASTAAVAADPALVVALSPNNNTLANALFSKTTDGTNTAAVKAASTAAVAADPALVVALSPNNNILANALFIKNTDGTNAAAVKAASTAAVATDPALVVAVSPNNTLPINQTQINAVTVLAGSGTTGTGSQRVTIAGHATGTITSVAGSITSVTALAANTARAGAMFFNDSTQTMYLALAATASTTSFTVQIAPNGYYELPATRVYNGIVTFIQGTANGNIRVTEITG